MSSTPRRVSDSAVRRLSLYLRGLEELELEGVRTVASEALARRAGTTAAQVRKDLSLFGSFGKRGLGYAVPPLQAQLRTILGLARPRRVALVGAGRIGAALFEYPPFRERGFRIVAIFDEDPAKIGRAWGGVPIHSAADLAETVRCEGVEIAILAIPAGAAQRMADALTSAGIRGILNFAPVQIQVPEGVVVNDVDMSVELEALTFALDAPPGGGRAGSGG
ncbi:MAG: redox-sensing transcriptional repressor Rex [Gemmatimonadota bacterium]